VAGGFADVQPGSRFCRDEFPVSRWWTSQKPVRIVESRRCEIEASRRIYGQPQSWVFPAPLRFEERKDHLVSGEPDFSGHKTCQLWTERRPRPIQGRTGVSVRLIIVSTTLHTSLSLPKWKFSYGKRLEGPYHVFRPQSLHVFNLHDWITFDGASPRFGSTLRLLVLVGLCIPSPHVLIRDHITFMAMPYFQNPRQTGNR